MAHGELLLASSAIVFDLASLTKLPARMGCYLAVEGDHAVGGKGVRVGRCLCSAFSP